MVGNALKLQSDGSDYMGAIIDLQVTKGLNRLTVAEIMANGSITGNGLANDRQTFFAHSGQHFFNAPVLIAKLDLQVQDNFTDTLKAKMAGFNNPGMYRSDCHFVDIFSFHCKIWVIARNIFFIRIPEDIRVVLGIGMISYHFQPGVIFGLNAILLSNFTFKHMKLFITCGQGREAFFNLAANHI